MNIRKHHSIHFLGLIGLFAIYTSGCRTSTPVIAVDDWPSSNASLELTSQSKTLIKLDSEEQFQQILDSSQGLVLVDFYAKWCGPCKRQAKVIEELVPEASQSQSTIVKVDVEQFPHLAKQYQVTSLPTLVAINQGSVSKRLTGFTQHAELAKVFKKTTR